MDLEQRITTTLWAWFLQRAKVHNVYYYYDMPEKVRQHLEECGIAPDSDRPDAGTVSQFADTESPNDELEAITVGNWRCNCGTYGDRYDVKSRNRLTLAIPGPYPVGDIIVEVARMAWEERTNEQE